MKTTHQFIFNSSSDMGEIPTESAGLVVTSPPYPMIEMWDEMFCRQNSKIAEALSQHRRMDAFELMNKELDRVWDEVKRVLIPGGFACINIGDATRTIDGHFMLYPNHARILSYMMKIGFTPLPEIIWRKPSNAPNKFMGSGMLPSGAYVTQEHEYILILRNGGKREFKSGKEKQSRRSGAFFWEERNRLFSDVWTDLLGARQETGDKEIRKRSGAYPFELPYRLINMYSAKGDLVVDPFGGLGTTMLAAMTAGRNSIGYEISKEFKDAIEARANGFIEFANERINKRLVDHVTFIENRIDSGKQIKYLNDHYNFPVITAQEKELLLNQPVSIRKTDETSFEVSYSDAPQQEIVSLFDDYELPRISNPADTPGKAKKN